LKWEEVERVLAKKNPDLAVFEAGQVLQRVEKMGDLFEPVLSLKQKLPVLQDLLEAGEVAEPEKLEIAAEADARVGQMRRKAERRGPPPEAPKDAAPTDGKGQLEPRNKKRKV
jgi:hypothetical protein